MPIMATSFPDRPGGISRLPPARRLPRRVVVLMVPLLLSCGGDFPSPATDGSRSAPFVGRGIVREVSIDPPVLLVDHDEIPGVMGAMTMAFPVADGVGLETLEVGEEIRFEIERLNDGHYRIFRVERLPD